MFTTNRQFPAMVVSGECHIHLVVDQEFHGQDVLICTLAHREDYQLYPPQAET